MRTATRHSRTVTRGGVAVLTAALLAAGLTAPAGASTAADDPSDPMQAALDGVTGAGIPGAVAATDDDGPAWRGHSGVGSLLTKKEPDADGRFRIASVSKPFTATLVLQLADERRIGLDDDIDRHLPGLLPYDEPITVRQLLQHTSGVPRDLPPHLTWESLPEIATERFHSYTPERMVRASTQQPLLFEPGTIYAYSNTGYTVLAMLVEKVTGTSFESALAERITGPLQLDDTASMRDFPLVRGATGRAYEQLFPEPVPRTDVTEYNYSRYIGSGSMISSADDVNRFFAALFGGELLSADMLREMTTDLVPGTMPDGSYAGFDYGLGVYRMSFGDECGAAWGHDGSLPGSGTISVHRYAGDTPEAPAADPEAASGVTLNINQNMTAPEPAAAAVWEVATTALCGDGAAGRSAAETPTPQHGPALADATATAAVGSYAHGHGNS
ncbi:serine hydrolase [Saccharomonospora sp. CUA-673]|uniref:serine hydrolase domain-containing protein n=1 Tax=Saccharomonospora sp. CUA-673 TaxID=1904969 RepID=UPI0009F822C7|nr:serine hydrolase domain-containing protein [Saccharomonospora sp. CUA-673]